MTQPKEITDKQVEALKAIAGGERKYSTQTLTTLTRRRLVAVNGGTHEVLVTEAGYNALAARIGWYELERITGKKPAELAPSTPMQVPAAPVTEAIAAQDEVQPLAEPVCALCVEGKYPLTVTGVHHQTGDDCFDVEPCTNPRNDRRPARLRLNNDEYKRALELNADNRAMSLEFGGVKYMLGRSAVLVLKTCVIDREYPFGEAFEKLLRDEHTTVRPSPANDDTVVTVTCPRCEAGEPYTASGMFHRDDTAVPPAPTSCALGGRQNYETLSRVPADAKNAPEVKYGETAGTPPSTDNLHAGARRALEKFFDLDASAATPVQDIKTPTPDFVCRNVTLYTFRGTAVENWSTLLRRVADWFDANPHIEENVTEFSSRLQWDGSGDAFDSNLEHVIEVVAPAVGKEAHLPRADGRPRLVSVDIPFDAAHDLVARGDCGCELAGQPCVVCVTRARLFQLTGNSMYADDRDDESEVR